MTRLDRVPDDLIDDLATALIVTVVVFFVVLIAGLAVIR